MIEKEKTADEFFPNTSVQVNNSHVIKIQIPHEKFQFAFSR
jgi:hypothetical protein